MTQTRGQDFDWSDCRLISSGNRPFLKDETDLISGEFERKLTLVFTPTMCALFVGAFLNSAPIWLTVATLSIVWIVALCMGLEGNRVLVRKTRDAILLKGEVSSITLPDTLDYGGSKVFVRFVDPNQQIIETHTHSQSEPDQWKVGDKVVVLFADNENFWVL